MQFGIWDMFANYSRHNGYPWLNCTYFLDLWRSIFKCEYSYIFTDIRNSTLRLYMIIIWCAHMMYFPPYIRCDLEGHYDPDYKRGIYIITMMMRPLRFLTHWGWHRMTTVLQTIFPNSIPLQTIHFQIKTFIEMWNYCLIYDNQALIQICLSVQ